MSPLPERDPHGIDPRVEQPQLLEQNQLVEQVLSPSFSCHPSACLAGLIRTIAPDVIER